jgi:hypothetical protein
MVNTQPAPVLNAPLLEALYNEMAQPLTVLHTLVELWERGLAEPEDLALMKQQVGRIDSTLREIRAFSDETRISAGGTEQARIVLPELIRALHSAHNHAA